MLALLGESGQTVTHIASLKCVVANGAGRRPSDNGMRSKKGGFGPWSKNQANVTNHPPLESVRMFALLCKSD